MVTSRFMNPDPQGPLRALITNSEASDADEA
jgi:hypothetical protein